MGRKEVARKEPPEHVRLTPLKTIRLMALITQARGILRPVAHRELREFAATARNTEEITALLGWGAKLLEADFRERYSLTRPETKLTVLTCPLPVFSRPDKAYKVRWMFRPRNLRAYARHIRENFGGGKNKQ
jgi:hypothetical protein